MKRTLGYGRWLSGRRLWATAALSVVAVTLLGAAAGHAGWTYWQPPYREGAILRPGLEGGVQYLGYPYGAVPYPTVADADSYICYSEPQVHAWGCQLRYTQWPVPAAWEGPLGQAHGGGPAPFVCPQSRMVHTACE